MLGCSGLESTRSEGISPQVTHWRLGKSDFTSVGEEDCRPNHSVSEEKFSFFMLIQHTFLNRKYSVDLKSEAYFASFLLWHLCMFSRLIAVIPYIHTCSDSTSNSLLRGYSSFFILCWTCCQRGILLDKPLGKSLKCSSEKWQKVETRRFKAPFQVLSEVHLRWKAPRASSQRLSERSGG